MDFRETRTDKILEYLCRIILAGTLVFLIAHWVPGSRIRSRHIIMRPVSLTTGAAKG